MSVPNVNAFLKFYQPNPPANLNGKAKERYITKRKFYSCNSDNGYDYVNYVNVGSKQKSDYVEYSGDDEKSKGLFSSQGKLSKRERKELKSALKSTQSIIWDLVISFEPSFGKEYCNDYEMAYRIMKSVIPRFFTRAGFDKNNMIWYAALHENRRHRHIHISFFEKEPKRFAQTDKLLHYSQGYIPQSCLNYLKLLTEERATDMTGKLYALRKALTQAHGSSLMKLTGETRYRTEFRGGLKELMYVLPKSGRLSYDSQNIEPFKEQINKLVDIAIKADETTLKAFENFCQQLQINDQQSKDMLARNKIDGRFWSGYLKTEKYLNDLYRRLGNQVLNSVRVFKRNEGVAHNKILQKRVQKANEIKMLDYAIKLQLNIETDAISIFNEYMKELEKERDKTNEQG